MKPTTLLLLFAAALFTTPAFAQKPARPENELLRQIEAVTKPAPTFKGAPTAAADIERKPEAPAAVPPKKDKGPTEISALEATFDQKASQAVFIGEVEVKDPEFNVKCDRLTAHLKTAEKADPKAPKPVAPAKAKGGGLQRAVAEANAGNRVIITQDKKEADGTSQHSAGEADRATYDAVTGDIVLTGSPEIQQGINRVVATAPGTVMILNRDGHMRAKGPHKTIIVDKGSGL